MAGGSLNASAMGIQVTGQNLSNVNTPGYTREQLILTTNDPPLNYRQNVIGSGVQVSGVVQVIDTYLEERLRGAISDATNSATQQKYTTELESLIQERTDTDLSTALDTFFNAIGDVLNNPETVSYRDMVVTQGSALAGMLNKLNETVLGLQDGINKTIGETADDINLLTERIRQLNISIAKLESGRSAGTEAVGLRDERQVALSQLAELVNIKVSEDASTGAVTVTCGGDMLVSGSYREEVHVDYDESEGGLSRAKLTVGKLRTDLNVSAGLVAGLYESRDVVLGGYAEDLDTFAAKLIESFNAVYCSGQGMTGYTNLTALQSVSDPDAPLSEAGLQPAIVNGAFEIQVVNDRTGVSTTYPVEIKVGSAVERDPFSLLPPVQGEGTSLQDVVDAINDPVSGVKGVTAELTARGELRLKADTDDVSFAFSDDSSGFLAAMGINTFFTGSGAGSIGLNATVVADPGKFAASSGGVAQDTENGVILAALPETKSAIFDQQSLGAYYNLMIDRVSVAGGTVKAIASSDLSYQATLQAQRDSISGVNTDEETINLLMYQRSYQATSKYITAINEMLTYLLDI